jgi:two-component system, LuxR family, response regulator FixJ
VSGPHTIYLIDDDQSILASVAGFLATQGFVVQTFETALQFLEAIGPGASGCVVTDMRMPSMSGLELVARIKTLGLNLPVIIITAYADVALTLEVSKWDAIDVLEKPFNNSVLVKAITRALAPHEEAKADERSLASIQARFSTLTAEERRVMALLVLEKSSKSVAQELEISIRTLEKRRAILMSKMRATSLIELVRMSSGIGPEN